MTPLDPSKPSILIKMGPFGHGKSSWDIGGRCMPNSGHAGCPGTCLMTIFGSHVGPHIANIGYMKVYEGLHALGGIPSFFSLSFRGMASESCLGTPGARVMTIFIKTYIWVKFLFWETLCGPRYDHFTRFTNCGLTCF